MGELTLDTRRSFHEVRLSIAALDDSRWLNQSIDQWAMGSW